MNTAVVIACTNKDNSHFSSLLDKQLEIHCKAEALEGQAANLSIIIYCTIGQHPLPVPLAPWTTVLKRHFPKSQMLTVYMYIVASERQSLDL